MRGAILTLLHTSSRCDILSVPLPYMTGHRNSKFCLYILEMRNKYDDQYFECFLINTVPLYVLVSLKTNL
jgi:hypothetical protein